MSVGTREFKKMLFISRSYSRGLSIIVSRYIVENWEQYVENTKTRDVK